MQNALEIARKHGAGILTRSPGGYWKPPKIPPAHAGVFTFGTTTIQGLVARELAEYTKWRDGRSGRFPVEVRVIDAGSVSNLSNAETAFTGPGP